MDKNVPGRVIFAANPEDKPSIIKESYENAIEKESVFEKLEGLIKFEIDITTLVLVPTLLLLKLDIVTVFKE